MRKYISAAYFYLCYFTDVNSFIVKLIYFRIDKDMRNTSSHSFHKNMFSEQVTNTIHYGHGSNYERFANGSYFICDTSYLPSLDENPETLESRKHYITAVEYDTDALYRTTDGYAGNCWTVKVVDKEAGVETTYHIRNWTDIVQNYQRRGYRFIE